MIGSLFLALPMQPWPSREQGMTWPQVFQSWSSWHCFKDRSGRARKILHQQFAWEVSLLAESGFCYETALDGDIHSDSSLVAGVSQRPGPQPRYRRRLAAASPGTRDGGGRAVPRGSSGRGGRREPRGGARPGQLFLPPTRTNPLSRFSALGNGAAACAPRCPRPGQPPAVAARRDGRRHARCGLGAVGTRRRAPGGPGPRPAGSGGWRGGPGADMPGPSPGGSPERETGAGGRPRGPGRDRRVRFRLPHTAIAVPSVREEEQLFYRRLEALAVPGPGGFGPLFASDGWSDLTEDRLLRKRMVRAGLGGPRPLPGQEVSVKVLGALEDGGLVERDPRLIFVPGHGDVVQALELGVPTMQPGEVSFFLAAFPYAYGHPGSSARARGGRGAAGAACEVPQQLRGCRAEAGADGRGAGGLRGGPADQPRQRPGVAPARAGGTRIAPHRPAPLGPAVQLPSAPLPAAAGRAGPGRRGGARPEESPGAGPGQQGDPHRALTAGEAPEPSSQHRPAESPPRPDTAAEPRIPRTALGGRSDLSGPAAPQSLIEEIEEFSCRPPHIAPHSRVGRAEGGAGRRRPRPAPPAPLSPPGSAPARPVTSRRGAVPPRSASCRAEAAAARAPNLPAFSPPPAAGRP
nr:collagen alpha-2(I) chain-like isoform X6 [Taeniopygia guttata]